MPNQVRGQPEQDASFGERLADEPEPELFEIAQPAVDEPRRSTDWSPPRVVAARRARPGGRGWRRRGRPPRRRSRHRPPGGPSAPRRASDEVLPAGVEDRGHGSGGRRTSRIRTQCGPDHEDADEERGAEHQLLDIGRQQAGAESEPQDDPDDCDGDEQDRRPTDDGAVSHGRLPAGSRSGPRGPGRPAPPRAWSAGRSSGGGR